MEVVRLLHRSAALAVRQAINSLRKEDLLMKKLASALALAFLASITLPVLAADEPKTPEDCKKMHAGDDAKIKACVDGLKK